MLTKRTIIVAGGAFLLTGLLFYFLSNGQEVAIKRHQIQAITIYGYAYEGEARGMGKVFERAEAVLPQGATLCALYETDPATHKDSMRAFVGYTGFGIIKDRNLEARTFGPQEVLTAKAVVTSIFSAPRVYESLANYAKGQGVKLTETSLELYPDDKTTLVHVPIVK